MQDGGCHCVERQPNGDCVSLCGHTFRAELYRRDPEAGGRRGVDALTPQAFRHVWWRYQCPACLKVLYERKQL